MMWLERISSVIILCFCILLCNGCNVNEDCDISNTVCLKTQCVCPKGFVMNSDMTNCLRVAEGYGYSCEDSIQCSAMLLTGGQCMNNTCDCADGYHYLKGRCWKTSGLGDSCAKNENCYINYDFEAAVCSNRKCVCSTGYYQREYSSCRRKSKAAGEACLISLDCDYPGSSCLKNRTCGYINETDENYIPPPPWPYPIHVNTNKKLGGKCSSNAECGGIKYAICNTSKECSCSPGYFPINGSLCYPEISSYCSSDSECIGRYTMCRENKNWCTCQDGYVPSPNNRFCTKMSRDIDWSCLSDRWCSTFGQGGICLNKKCTCDNTTHYVPQQYYCWISKKVGEKCLQSEDCGNDGVGETCSKNVCTCKQGFHSATNKTVCRSDGKHIGDFCQEDLDCFIKHSKCNVTDEKCICESGYMLLDNTCLPGVGAKCDATEKCHAIGSVCNDSVCACDDNHVSSSDYSECLEKANDINRTCTESQQCTPLLGVGGMCDDGNCTCSDGFHEVESFCYVNIALYKTCSKSPQCQVENGFTECRNGVCQCMYEHPPDAFNRTCTGGANTIIMAEFLLLLCIYIINVFR